MSDRIARPAPATPAMAFADPTAEGYRCYLCGGQTFTRLHAWPVGDRWNPARISIAVWQCGCGIVFLYPVPGPEQLPDCGDWWSKRRKRPRRNLTYKRIRAAVSHALVGSPRYRFVKYTRKAIASGKLLDVGCGDGRLLQVAGPHYDCVGLEPSPIAAEQARRKGFPVLQTAFETARLRSRSFDVVTLDSVIEHVRNPLHVLRKANRILKPGCVIALKTNKFNGPAYRMHGRGWYGFRHGYHTFLFTGKTLSRTLEAAGFEVLKRPKRDRLLDDILILWGRKVREVEPASAAADPSCSASGESSPSGLPKPCGRDLCRSPADGRLP
ncbi:MAG: class I SAM-dependent methyltransferase [Pirellulales bacterium]|nr:class I SAM-dependent methyltransferase [Pirellulales bacterium]